MIPTEADMIVFALEHPTITPTMLSQLIALCGGSARDFNTTLVRYYLPNYPIYNDPTVAIWISQNYTDPFNID